MISLNDFALLGYWPLNEPSGTPLHYNYTEADPDPANNGRIDGLSYHLHVHTTNADTFEPRAFFPGSQISNMTSGTNTLGYVCNGTYDQTPNDDGPFEKVLVVGTAYPNEGNRGTQGGVAIPQVAQSGFTVGFWVLPQTSGFVEVPNLATPRLESSIAHALVSQGISSQGFAIGVSGFPRNDATGSNFVEDYVNTRQRQLRAYAHYMGSSDLTSVLLDTPIESGRYTHIAATYRFNAINDNEWVLYKDGRVEGSGTSTFELTETGATTFADIPMIVGGFSLNGTRVEWATGFGHMISGLYAFRRVLDEGEMLEMHNQGGIQPGSRTTPAIPEGTAISIDDDAVIGYYPFLSPGYPDASKNRNPLYCQVDEGKDGQIIGYTGPFGDRGGYLNDGATSPTDALVCGSGTMELLRQAINDQGFTISFWAEPEGGASYPANIMAAFGGSNGSSITLSLTTFSAGMVCCVDDEAGANSPRTKVVFYTDGDPAQQTILRQLGTDAYPHLLHHVAILFSNPDKGVALYVDGEFQASGTVDARYNTHLTNLIGSGLGLCFNGGIADADPTTFVTNGGQDSAITEIGIFNRPLRADEIVFLSQSGIDLSKNYYTPNDPRLRAYWNCKNSIGDNPLYVEDRARVWNRRPLPLTRAEPAFRWSIISDAAATSPFIPVDLFGDERTLGAVYDGFGDLGITSGVYAVYGGSDITLDIATVADNKSSLNSSVLRLRPAVGQRDSSTPFLNEEYILSFEVTPSGNIPNSTSALNREFNSVLTSISDGVTTAIRQQFVSYLTTINANNPDPAGFDAGTGASGVSIVFEGIDGNPATAGTTYGLLSGVLTYGVPNKVMFHMKPVNPHTYTETAGGSVMEIDLYVEGNKVNSRRLTANEAKIWSDQAPDATAADQVIEIGGYAVDDAQTGDQASYDTGLGDIYMREIFIAKGKFSPHDVSFFAQSGIARSSTLNGFNDQATTSIVRVNDSRLAGYYRFTGGPGGSGHLDLSSLGNNLSNLAEQAINDAVTINGDSYAFNVRWVPGPLKQSRLTANIGDILGQASGITVFGNTPGSAGDSLPVFAVSGTKFDDPQNGFSVGFWYSYQDDVATTNDYRAILSYGQIPGTAIDTSTLEASWAVVVDDLENIKLVLSKDGRFYVDPSANAAKAGSLEVGTQSLPLSYLGEVSNDITRQGIMSSPHGDSWNHYAWTFNASTGRVNFYFNGSLADTRLFSSNGSVDTLNTPSSDSYKILTVLTGQTSPWTWSNTAFDDAGVLTDVFYFDAPLDENEIRYIAFNGIAESDTPQSSGIIGGHVYASDLGSGNIGGWLRGFDEGSGIIGAWIEGGIAVSGIVGGFIRAQGQASGIIGGWLTGFDTSSGVIVGGQIFATIVASGIAGGWINGGLSGAVQFDGNFNIEAASGVDFDSFVHILRKSSADFDAKLEIYEAECPPEVSIVIPETTISGLAPPFNQYFVGFASGLQGKTINSTKWSFGDFTPSVAGSESGSSPGYYPVQHRFAASGFYVVKFQAVDSDGKTASALRYVHAASGIDPVSISLSGVPQIGEAELVVDFDQNYNSIPPGVSISASLLDLDNGNTTIQSNPTIIYTQPGIYKPIWCVRDSRGVIWCDSLEPGNDLIKANNESGI